MIGSIIGFLVMLNPFALFIYLAPVMKELEHKDFLKVLIKATLISLVFFLFFMLSGDLLFQKILQIKFDSFRIFGGIVIFSFAYLYIVKGQRAIIQMKSDLDDLASEIALPFMVGAGTISLSILMGYNFSYPVASIGILATLLINFVLIIVLKSIKDDLEKKMTRIAFDKFMEILLRINGFFAGAIGINMIITGILQCF